MRLFMLDAPTVSRLHFAPPLRKMLSTVGPSRMKKTLPTLTVNLTLGEIYDHGKLSG